MLSQSNPEMAAGNRVRLPVEKLTKREREVVRLLGKGLSRAEIAKSIFRSPKTIDNHCSRIYEKLGVRSQAQLMSRLHESQSAYTAFASEDGRTGLGSTRGESLRYALAQIEATVQSMPESRYFHAILLGLCDALGVEFGGVCEVDHQAGQFIVVAMVANGEPTEQKTVDLKSCLSTSAFSDGQYVLQRGVGDLNPRPAISDLGAESYAGIALDDQFVGKVGTLWVASKSPIEAPEFVLSVLIAMRRRATTELALQVAIDRLEEAGLSIRP